MQVRVRRRTAGGRCDRDRWVLALAVDGLRRGGAQPAPTLRSGSAEPSTPKAQLTFGVYGPKDETAPSRAWSTPSTRSPPRARSGCTPGPSHGDMMADLRSGGGPASHLPDVFMVSRGDLAWLQDEAASPSRSTSCSTSAASTSVTATPATRSGVQRRQPRCSACPTAISPMVIYYNTELVDFDEDAARAASTRPTSSEQRTHAGPSSSSPPPREFATPAPRAAPAACYIDADAARAGAVHLLRRRQDLRRRGRSPPRWPSPTTTPAPRWSARSSCCATRT